MRRLASLPLAVLLAGMAAGPALAAPASSACHLAGFVRTSAQRCPQALAAGTAPRPQFLGLGGIFGGLVGGAVKKVLSIFVSWVNDGAADALRFTASLIGSSTEPALQSTWFSSAYWRVAALSALLTVPFLFAAAIHAIVRSDLALLGRAAFGYLPLAMIGVGIAAPLTALVLSATDEMCSFVAAAGGNADTTFLGHAASAITASSIISTDPFVAFFAGMLTVAATLALWLELLIRAAAVDVIVLMLPLFFAAMVWPARRLWAIRAIETLIALILAKFGIIAVLTLGGAAINDAASGLSALLIGATLILLATVSPWALLRILPLHEVAAAAAGGLSQAPRDAFSRGRDRLAAMDGPSGSSEDDPADIATELPEYPRTPELMPGRDRGPGRDPSPLPEDLGPETASGVAAVERAGRSPVHDPDHGAERRASPTATDPPAAGAAPRASATGEDRPPINDAFAAGEWAPYVLGDGVSERMSAPRFVSGRGGADGSPGTVRAPGPGPTPAADAVPASAAPAPAADPLWTEPPPDEPPRVEPPPVEPPPVEPPRVEAPPVELPRPAARTDRSTEA